MHFFEPSRGYILTFGTPTTSQSWMSTFGTPCYTFHTIPNLSWQFIFIVHSFFVWKSTGFSFRYRLYRLNRHKVNNSKSLISSTIHPENSPKFSEEIRISDKSAIVPLTDNSITSSASPQDEQACSRPLVAGNVHLSVERQFHQFL